MLLNLILISAISHAFSANTDAEPYKDMFEVLAVKPVAMKCVDGNQKPTGKTVMTTFCNLDVRPSKEKSKTLTATAAGELCKLKVGKQTQLTLVSNMCRMFIPASCTPDGKPKDAKQLLDLQSMSCGTDAKWMVFQPAQ